MRTARAALAVVLVALACGGGGGGGGGGGPTQPVPSISYTPESSSGSSSLALVEAGGSSTQLRLNLDAQTVSGLYGVGFDLLYPADVLTFVSVTLGTFLGSSGNTTLQVNSSNPGRVIVGLSRLGAIGGVSGSGTLLTVELRAAGAAGGGELTFENNGAFDSSAKPIAGITWFAGSVTVTP
jgi:hypothetical protein